MAKERYGGGAARVYGLLIDPLVARLRPRIVRICRDNGVASVLDIACATGAQCRALARTGIRATGLDLSEPMIAAARRHAGPRADYVVGSALALPFPDGAFDAAILSLALHEHPEAERSVMLGEAARVVRPEGLLLVADYTRPRRTRAHVPWAVVRFVEGIAGDEHRAGFHDFMHHGGLAGLLERSDLPPLRVDAALFGTIGVAVVRIS